MTDCEAEAFTTSRDPMKTKANPSKKVLLTLISFFVVGLIILTVVLSVVWMNSNDDHDFEETHVEAMDIVAAARPESQMLSSDDNAEVERRMMLTLEEELKQMTTLDHSMFNLKLQVAEKRFVQRFPRQVPESIYKPRNPGRAQQKVNKNVEKLNNEDKVELVIARLDLDGDGRAGAWELHDWMVWLENTLHLVEAKEQWMALGMESGQTLDWPHYQSTMNPLGIKKPAARRRADRDQRRWRNADRNGDNVLDETEFTRFIFPKAAHIFVREAHEAVDSDYDGRVSEDEFFSIFRNPSSGGPQPHQVSFWKQLDKDLNGFLDGEEFAMYVDPLGFVQAKSEVVYLMEMLDTNRDKMLSIREILSNPEPFLESQATYFGKLFTWPNLRQKVLMMS